MTAEHSPAANRGTAVAYVGTWWAMAQFIGPVVLGGLVTAIGLRETLVLLGLVSFPLAFLSPVLFRVLLPRPKGTALDPLTTAQR